MQILGFYEFSHKMSVYCDQDSDTVGKSKPEQYLHLHIDDCLIPWSGKKESSSCHLFYGMDHQLPLFRVRLSVTCSTIVVIFFFTAYQKAYSKQSCDKPLLLHYHQVTVMFGFTEQQS